MRGRLRLVHRCALAALSLGLGTASAAPAPAPFSGMSWTVPAGLELSPSARDCPGRCVGYRARNINNATLYVHEAVLGDNTYTLGRYRGFLERRLDRRFKVMNEVRDDLGGGLTSRLVTLVPPEGDGRGENHSYFFLSRGGVTVTLELEADGLEGLKQALPLLGKLTDSVKFDPTAIKKDIGARNGRFAEAVAAIAKGYAAGGQAQLYEHSEVVSVNSVTNMGILQTDSYIQTEMLAFLPGGVFLKGGGPNFRFPDLRAAWEGEPPARWAAVPGGFKVTLPDGKTAVYKRQTDREGGGYFEVSENGKKKVYFEQAPLTAKDLIGSYSRSSSGVSAGLPTTVITSSSEELVLKADGSFEASRSSMSSLSNGPGSLGGNPNLKTDATVEGSGGGRGQWSYHPGSFTLTLKFADGTVQSGPAYTSASRKSLNQKKPNTLWTLLDGPDWSKK